MTDEELEAAERSARDGINVWNPEAILALVADVRRLREVLTDCRLNNDLLHAKVRRLQALHDALSREPSWVEKLRESERWAKAWEREAREVAAQRDAAHAEAYEKAARVADAEAEAWGESISPAYEAARNIADNLRALAKGEG